MGEPVAGPVVSPVSMSVVSALDAAAAAGELENAAVLCCGSRRSRISCMAMGFMPSNTLQHLGKGWERVGRAC